MSVWLKVFFSMFKKEGRPTTVIQAVDGLPRQQDWQTQSTRHKQRGDGFLAQGKLDEAAACYRQAIAENLQEAHAHLNLGFVLGEQKRYKEAEAALMLALEIDPTLVDAFYILGVLDKAQANTAGAIANFSKVIALKPDFKSVYGELSQLLFDSGQAENAREVIRKAIVLYPDAADFHEHMGNLYAAENATDQAINCFKVALSIQPDFARLHNSLGAALVKLSMHEDALNSFDRAIQFRPDYLEAINNRGIALGDLGRTEESLACYRKALQFQPDSLAVLSNYSNLLLKLKCYRDALAGYDRLLQLLPLSAEMLSNRGIALEGLGRHGDALDCYEQALQLKPDSADTFFNRGNALLSLGRAEEALASYDRSLQLRRDDPHVLCNRGNALRRLRRVEEALDCYELILQMTPDSADAFSNRGAALADLHRYEEALASYSQALLLNPEHVDAHFNECACRLLCADFELGWQKYEWRWRVSGQAMDERCFTQPLWLGSESLSGKVILLRAEQGFGDTIQFCRYAKLVAAIGARVLLEVQPGLDVLMSNLEGVDQVIVKGEPLPTFDYHCPLASLPLAFSTRLETIPAEPSYLGCNPVRAKAWQEKLGEKTRPRVGLVWSGNAAQANDHNRSIPLSRLLNLLSDKVQYVSLQKEVRSDDVRVLAECNQIAFLGNELADFSETAALIANMDLVISVCTSVAHLAGAMGKPVWLLLSFNADWRWLLGRDDSPWYPSARLFRQEIYGDWEGVVSMVAKEVDVWSGNFYSGANVLLDDEQKTQSGNA
jgi:tetratricopeptide (TPR) repeat protein